MVAIEVGIVLLIHPDHLLPSGNDAGFRRRRSADIDHRLRLRLDDGQHVTELPAACIVADGSHEIALRSERTDVVGHVGRPEGWHVQRPGAAAGRAADAQARQLEPEGDAIELTPIMEVG